MKKLMLLLVAIATFSLAGCTNVDNESDKPIVAVTIVPQAAFVEAIAGDLLEVVTIVPPGSSPETYEPTPQTMVKVTDSIAYFTIGVPTEAGNILPETNDGLNVINLEDKVNDVYPDLMFSETSRDPHIWLSLKRVKVMIEVIKDELIKVDPDNEATYTANYNTYLAEVNSVQTQINTLFEDKTVRSFIVYHPAWQYFADDLNLDMIALQEDGKDASVQRIQEVIDFAKANNISHVFFQSQIHSSQIESLVDELNASQTEINPLAENYLENYLAVATAIASSLS